MSKKDPVTPEMSAIRFAGPTSNLSDLRLAAICVTAFTSFLRYNKLANLRCVMLNFVILLLRCTCLRVRKTF